MFRLVIEHFNGKECVDNSAFFGSFAKYFAANYQLDLPDFGVHLRKMLLIEAKSLAQKATGGPMCRTK